MTPHTLTLLTCTRRTGSIIHRAQVILHYILQHNAIKPGARVTALTTTQGENGWCTCDNSSLTAPTRHKKKLEVSGEVPASGTTNDTSASEWLLVPSTPHERPEGADQLPRVWLVPTAPFGLLMFRQAFDMQGYIYNPLTQSVTPADTDVLSNVSTPEWRGPWYAPSVQDHHTVTPENGELYLTLEGRLLLIVVGGTWFRMHPDSGGKAVTLTQYSVPINLTMKYVGKLELSSFVACE